MFLNVYWFPNIYLEALRETMKPDNNEKLALKITIFQEIPRDDSEFTEIIFEAESEAALMLLGIWVGMKYVTDGVNAAMPQVYENIHNLVEKVKQPSEN